MSENTTIQLRDGSVTEDPRLDRLEEFDHRSRNFGVSQLVSDDLPSRGRTWYQRTWLDQGREGACVSFGWHHELAGSPVAVKGITNELAHDRYWTMQRDYDEWPGGSYPGAQPFYEGTSTLAGAKLMVALGYIESYYWAFTIEDIIRSIVQLGPGVAGIPWKDSMFDTRPSGLLDCSGRVVGGHCIQIRGVAMKPRLKGEKITVPTLRLHNSWNRDWGHDGDAYITVTDFWDLMTDGGDYCIPQGRKNPVVAS